MLTKLKLLYLRWKRITHIDNATFLLDKGGYRCMNFLSFNATFAEFKNMVKRCKALGADTLYLYFSNAGDGKPNPTSFYVDGNLISGTVSVGRVKEMQKRLMYAIEEGMYIDGWLFADDSPAISKQPLNVKLAYAKDVIANFDSYLDRYVVALEANEHLRVDEVLAIARELRKTRKPVGLHLTTGEYAWSANSEIDIHYHQYGFERSPAYIASETSRVKTILKKPVIAAEYDLSSTNRVLGQAAIKSGAKGTGNGR